MKEPGEPTAPAARKEHREIQRGRETKAAEGTNQNRAGFNIEKGVGNCKRKREKKKKRGRWLETKKVLGGELLCLALLHQPSLQQERRAAEGSRGSGAARHRNLEQEGQQAPAPSSETMPALL